MEHISEKLAEIIAVYGAKLALALVILIGGISLARMMRKMLKSSLVHTDVDQALVSFVGDISHVVLILAVAIAALDTLGVQTTSFLAILGSAGLAVAMGLKGSMNNMTSGMLVLFFHPFRVGDTIEIDGVQGVVEEIRVMNTILCTPEKVTVHIPNSFLTSHKLLNLSAREILPLTVNLTLSQFFDHLQLETRIGAMLKQESAILDEPEPHVYLVELAGEKVQLSVHAWVPKDELKHARNRLMANLQDALKAEELGQFSIHTEI